MSASLDELVADLFVGWMLRDAERVARIEASELYRASDRAEVVRRVNEAVDRNKAGGIPKDAAFKPMVRKGKYRRSEDGPPKGFEPAPDAPARKPGGIVERAMSSLDPYRDKVLARWREDDRLENRLCRCEADLAAAKARLEAGESRSDPAGIERGLALVVSFEEKARRLGSGSAEPARATDPDGHVVHEGRAGLFPTGRKRRGA